MINRHEEFTAVVVIAMFLLLKHYGCYHAVIVVKFIVLYQFIVIEKLKYFPTQIPLPLNL